MKNKTRGLVLVGVLSLMLTACGDNGARSGSDEDVAVVEDPRAQIIEILDVPDRLDRVEQLITALRAYPPERANELGEMLRERELPFHDLERVLVVAGWSRLDPAAATEWTITWERPGPTRNEEIAEAVGAWARKDPHALVQAHDMGQLSGTVPHVIVALVEGWFASGQDGLEQYVAELGQGDTRDRAIGTLVRVKLARDGPEATEAWAILLSQDANFKQQAYSRLGGELTYVDPQAAIAWCKEVCETPLGDSVMHRTAVKWAEHSPKEAMDWISSQKDVVENRATIRAVYRRYQMSDITGANEWIEATTEDQRRTPMLQGPVGMYINRHSVREPLKAIAWTDYLIDESERELALITIARRWLKSDVDAAEAWLADSPLSEAARAEAHGPPVRFGVSQQKKK